MSPQTILQNARGPVNEKRWLAHKEMGLTLAAIAATMLFTWLVAFVQGGLFLRQIEQEQWGGLTVHAGFITIVAFLVYGGLVYQFCRWGYIRRLAAHRPATYEELESIYEGDAPALCILVPSYKEDEQVVAQTLLSAALQEYPSRRVVLLIDDPPNPSSPTDAASLSKIRGLASRIQAPLSDLAHVFQNAESQFLDRSQNSEFTVRREMIRLACLYEIAADWLESKAGEYPLANHTDQFFVGHILRLPAGAHRARARVLREKSKKRDCLPALQEIAREYRRLATLFHVEITSFERKRFINLSHESNKAMNLNSYIGLAGKAYRILEKPAGILLEQADSRHADMVVPHADYFITLDADSLLMPEYALRLVHFMEQKGNERVAVAQTPYSAVPGTSNVTEYIAGATTDLQYVIHQGFTYSMATYWVGANALLRRKALDDIAVEEMERGFPVRRFIQDRTVIEDTESSVDLAVRGWSLYNYPGRLAYSATPPDFGSLLIQRRRWANGGLIILPKLLRYLLRQPHRKLGEGFMRIHYLISITAVNAGLLCLLAFPFTLDLMGIWLPLTAVPYFILYTRDLRMCGYRRRDMLRVYAMNLLLIPVNLGGVLKSLQQAITRQKIPFGRTPKVVGRTAAPALYLTIVYILLLHWSFGAGIDFLDGLYLHGVFALANALFLLYAIGAFVGFRNSRDDIVASFRRKGLAEGGLMPSASAEPAHETVRSFAGK